MLPGNNMHFIFFPSLCLYHSHPNPLLSLSPLPSPFIPSLTALSSLLYPLPDLFFPPHVPSVFSISLSFLDFQSCLICVARRVPMKERPMLPPHESFTTRQDLQGTQISHKATTTNIFLTLWKKRCPVNPNRPSQIPC